MKTLASFVIGILIAISAHAQTLVVSNILKQVPKASAPCTPTYKYVGFVGFTNATASNGYFFPATNIFTVTFPSNSDLRINFTSSFGLSGCGQGSVTVTDIFYPNDVFKFNGYWSNNVTPVPTNQQVILILDGLRTNAP